MSEGTLGGVWGAVGGGAWGAGCGWVLERVGGLRVLLGLDREKVSSRVSEVRMWEAQGRSWRREGLRLWWEASLGRPV